VGEAHSKKRAAKELSVPKKGRSKGSLQKGVLTEKRQTKNTAETDCSIRKDRRENGVPRSARNRQGKRSRKKETAFCEKDTTKRKK